ncbi:MAG: hypothetical protein GFH27_549297n216 [Chloroflexi bacterium AL-W]|nr:hypothetical protein [Chloroflexi bacterium AL-N1]NOK68930.1 hypothetical protein [Chloroflexi bacterium AL-N10]NOK76913.1 hypothetical protein [Chloroflexi bacterium AL-N5]NOK82699.1 hypothetical protein [Chloroflexi bacterium AL-W]NOK90770.1 hypothetical protein [Chloroflexi bacterium AL-N15]
MAFIAETRDLTHMYDSNVALDHLTLQIPEGSVFGFIGPNGAGKTTTMRILTTLLTPASGRAWVGGIPVTKDPQGVRQIVGFMPDFFGVYDNMKSWEYLDFFGRAYGVPADRRSTLIKELLELVDLGHKHDDYVMGLSRGMKQRLSLARTMIHDPSLLILDEPASGLDPRARIELRELLKELRAMGKTIMISSHILTELAEMCTHIAIIERGRLLASGDVKDIMRSLQSHLTLEIRILEGVDRAEHILRGHPDILKVQREPAVDYAGNEDNTPESIDDNAIHETDTETITNDHTSETSTQTLLIDYTGDERGASELLAQLITAGVVVVRFSERHSDLEDIFMQVTQGLVQ